MPLRNFTFKFGERFIIAQIKMFTYPTVQTIKLGIFFFLIFTAYTSFQTIVTYIYEQQGLTAAGPLNFIFNYLAFMISNLFAPKCKLSFKMQMIIGSLGHGFNVATGLYVPYIENKLAAYTAISFGGVVAGSVAGFMWISQGGYLREVVKTESDKGKYSGIFQLLYSFSSLIAGFITTFFLGYFSNQTYFIVLTVLSGTAGLFAFLFFRDIKQQRSQEVKEKENICKSLKSSFLFYPKMLPVLVMLLLDGVVLGMYCNQVIRLMPFQEDKLVRNRLAGIITIFIGFGCMCGGFLSGMISDRFGLLNTGRFTLSYYILCSVATFAAIYYGAYWFVCFVGFLWGSAYYFFQGWIYVAILKLYAGSLEAFSINKMLHCVSFAIFQIIVLVTDNQIDLKILVPIIAFLAIPSLWSISKADYSNQNMQGSSSTKGTVLSQQPEPSPLNYTSVESQKN